MEADEAGRPGDEIMHVELPVLVGHEGRERRAVKSAAVQSLNAAAPCSTAAGCELVAPISRAAFGSIPISERICDTISSQLQKFSGGAMNASGILQAAEMRSASAGAE